MSEKIDSLLSFIGKTHQDLPLAIISRIIHFEQYGGQMNSPELEEAQILDSIKTWYNAQAPKKITIIPQEVGNRFYSLVNSARIVAIDKDVNYWLAEIENLHRSVHKYLREKVAPLREERLRLLGALSRDLTEELNKILEDPFWRYLDAGGDNVYFLTKPVTIRQFEPNTGVNVAVPLGVFKVEFSLSHLKVTPYFDGEHPNTGVQGYYHPHISSTGGVCWGTAHQVYTDGIKNFRFKPIFVALRAILENYNADSPYVELYRFLLKQGKLDLSKYTVEYRKNGDYTSEYTAEDDMPDDFCYGGNTYEESSDDIQDEDEDYVTAYRLTEPYMKYVKELGYYLENEEFYYKTKTGEYKLWSA